MPESQNNLTDFQQGAAALLSLFTLLSFTSGASNYHGLYGYNYFSQAPSKIIVLHKRDGFKGLFDNLDSGVFKCKAWIF